jgi:hypothetical protein
MFMRARSLLARALRAEYLGDPLVERWAAFRAK